MFDESQQAVMKKFACDGAINGYLTGKVDGSLLEVNVYPRGSEQFPIMVKFLEDKRLDDPFVCVLLDECLKKRGDEFPLLVVSTQGRQFHSGLGCELVRLNDPFLC